MVVWFVWFVWIKRGISKHLQLSKSRKTEQEEQEEQEEQDGASPKREIKKWVSRQKEVGMC